jgi:hypothetical protein
MNDLIVETILPNEYPPKYVGYKGNGKQKMVYRIDGEYGLVFYNQKYKWEHFKIIK